MALFKARRKDIEEFETEMSLPAFRIDTNGYVMFENGSLGGACVMEVVPLVSTEGMTHEDPVYHNESTEKSVNPSYEPTCNILFGDCRRKVIPGWASFLNSLMPSDDSDEPTHVQILIKKCHADEWYTRMDYACYEAHKEYDRESAHLSRTGSLKDALVSHRMKDYMGLLDAINDSIKKIPPSSRDVRSLATYKTKFFIVVSYTPSSEGWWFDGRDEDYYVSDHASPIMAFASSQDKIVDRIADLFAKRIVKKEESNAPDDGRQDDFFWIEADRTAQIIATRVNKIKKAMREWNKSHKNLRMPFNIVEMDPREVAALIRLFPNIVTPYWDKIWNLQSNQNNMLYDFDVDRAITLEDAHLLGDQEALFEDIKSGTVDMLHSEKERENFLAQFRGVAYEELGNMQSEYKKETWTVEKEIAQSQHEKERLAAIAAQGDLWSDFDEELIIDPDLMNEEQQKKEFLSQYKIHGRQSTGRNGGNINGRGNKARSRGNHREDKQNTEKRKGQPRNLSSASGSDATRNRSVPRQHRSVPNSGSQNGQVRRKKRR